MTGESDLSILLRSMQPVLLEPEFVFCSVVPEAVPTFIPQAWGMFREAEGATLILEASAAQAHGLPAETSWALITLTVHSALTAVGFLAAIRQALAKAGISVNSVSAYHLRHDAGRYQGRDVI